MTDENSAEGRDDEQHAPERSEAASEEGANSEPESRVSDGGETVETTTYDWSVEETDDEAEAGEVDLDDQGSADEGDELEPLFDGEKSTVDEDVVEYERQTAYDEEAAESTELPPETDDEPLEPPQPQEIDPKQEVRRAVLDEVWAFFAERIESQREAAEEAATAESLGGIGKIIANLRERFGDTTPSVWESFPDEEFVREEWFDFSYLDDFQQIDRAWVTYPYAFISILYDPKKRVYRYHVTEPQLSEFEKYVREDLTTTLRNSLMYRDLTEEQEREEAFTEKMREILDEHGAAIPDGTVSKLMYYYSRDFLGYGRIDPIMRDRGIEDISCDGERIPVYIYHRDYRDLRTNVSFDTQYLNSMVVKLAQRAGKHISVSNPLVDASLPDGSRIQLTLGTDVSTRGSNFTIRKFSEVPHTPVDLIKWNTFSVEQMAYFWLAIENNMSLVFAGGTGSGKTTSMNAVSLFIPPDSKVVSIEDTREIVLPHDNWVQSITRESATASGQGDITTYNLLQASLRQRPEYILVGEIRTEQRVALTFFQAIGTGHTAYSTFHADSIEAALARLQNPPLSVPVQMLHNLDIISIQRQVTRGHERVRRNERISEIVMQGETSNVETQTVFERQPNTDEHTKVRESEVLQRIAYRQGWSEEEIQREYDNRCEVISYLVDEDITEFDDVTTIIESYSRAPDQVLEYVRSGSENIEELFAQ